MSLIDHAAGCAVGSGVDICTCGAVRALMPKPGSIHPLAHVGPDVKLGLGVSVWQFASVIRGATLGDGCNIASCAIVDGATLGKDCKVGHGASVHPGAQVGDEVFIGPSACLCNDMWPRVDNIGFDMGKLFSGPPSIIIEDGASIGAHAVVLPGVRIGRKAFVAAGSVVTADVPPFGLWTRQGTIKPHVGSLARQRMREAV